MERSCSRKFLLSRFGLSYRLAILGLTYQFTTNLIDRERYETFAAVLENEVTRLNIAPAQSQNSNGGFSTIHHPDDRSIRPSEEFRFLLFRHWNLYDSMFHSGYVAGKMKLWRDRGRKNLQGLLAKMGFSLEQCKQSFTHMDMDLKRSLRSKVEQVSPEYGLFDIAFPSFTRSFGYQSILSASDVVECVSALLEVANGVRLDFGNEIGGAVWSGSKAWDSSIGKEDGGAQDDYEDSGYGGSDKENNGHNNRNNDIGNIAHNAAARAEEAAAVVAAKAKKREEAWWVRNFWMAYDSLGNE
jgi:cell division control protein 45